MLGNIVSGLSPSALVCIEDSVEQSGHDLLATFVQNAISSGDSEVHIFCFENSIARVRKLLSISESSNIHFHDCFSDPHGWLQGLKKNNSTWNVVPELGTDKCVVIIDSLSPLILNIGFANCYRQLHKLMRCKKVMQSVCLVHEDSMPDAHILLPQLQHLATTTIRVEPPSKNSKGNPISSLTHKKPGGRVAREVEFYRSEIDGKFTSHKLEAVKGKLEAPSDESTLPQDLTTFKLSLGSQEKQARSELVLPYVRTNEDKGGKVFYQPDAGDDWDEEDPDDDLDI